MNNKSLYIGALVVRESDVYCKPMQVIALLENNRFKYRVLGSTSSGEEYSSEVRFATDKEIRLATYGK